MQFSNSAIISIASLLASVSAENIIVALNSDVAGNVNDYLQYVQQNTEVNAAPLLSLYQQAQTYTDDSYTTLITGEELSSLSAFVTQLPWYSSRIEPNVDDASATSSEEASSAPSATSSVAPSTTASVAPSTSSSVAPSTSSSSPVETSSTPAEISTSTNGNATESSTQSVSSAGAANLLAPGFALALGAIALL